MSLISEKYRKQWRTGLYAANPAQCKALIELIDTSTKLDNEASEALLLEIGRLDQVVEALNFQLTLRKEKEKGYVKVIEQCLDEKRKRLGDGWALAITWLMLTPKPYSSTGEDHWRTGKLLAALPAPLEE